MAELLRAWLGAGLNEARFWEITPRLYLAQIDAALAARKRWSDQVITAGWLAGAIGRMKDIPQLSELLGDGAPRRSPEEASLELQAQMRVYRETMAREGRIRSWTEWQTASAGGSAHSSGSTPASSTAT